MITFVLFCFDRNAEATRRIVEPYTACTPFHLGSSWFILVLITNPGRLFETVSLFPQGRDALLADPTVVPALESLAEHGWLQESKECGEWV